MWSEKAFWSYSARNNSQFPTALPSGKTRDSIARSIARGESRIESHADMLRVHITTATKLLASFEDAGIISRTKEGILIHDVNRLDSVGMD